MGIFTNRRVAVTTTVRESFADQLTAIKESFRTAYQKAETLNQKIDEDIKAKTASIEALKAKLAESEAAKNDTEVFMKNLEKFI